MIGDACVSLFKISTLTFKEGRKPTGLIFASPILLLQEGQRTIKIKLHFNVNTAVNSGSSTEPATTEPANTGEGIQRSNVIGGLSNAFIATASGKDDWLSLNNTVTTYDALAQTIDIKISLSPLDGAILGYQSSLPGCEIQTVQPVIKLMLDENAPDFLSALLSLPGYDNISIDVDVTGICTLELKNSNGELNLTGGFLPFGTNPLLNSDFYVGSSEFESKSISSITFHSEWAGVPLIGIGAYYQDYYMTPAISQNSFKISISAPDDSPLVNRGVSSGATVFDDNSPIINRDVSSGATVLDDNLPIINKDLSSGATVFELFNTDSSNNIYSYIAIQAADGLPGINKNRFYKLSLLSPDFSLLTEKYRSCIAGFLASNAQVFVNKALKLPSINDESVNKILPLPKPPFQLEIKNLTVDYTASIESTTFNSIETGLIQVFLIATERV